MFQETGSAYAVVKRFAEDGLRFPKRAYGGRAGRLIWGRLSHERVIGLIRNPSYAGIYVFGRYQFVSASHRRERPTRAQIWVSGNGLFACPSNGGLSAPALVQMAT
ncbi:recombinase family protein [Paraburkholderia humisilvae]|uniref:recombinase family protein n=1 Tax=Paraburkholderia humisilvae TaxID=627669 RepID=UPI0035EDD32A